MRERLAFWAYMIVSMLLWAFWGLALLGIILGLYSMGPKSFVALAFAYVFWTTLDPVLSRICRVTLPLFWRLSDHGHRD